MSRTIRAGDNIFLNPLDQRVINFDWDSKALQDSVTISSSTWTITVQKQNDSTGSGLTKDSEAVLSGNRSTQVRLLATTASEGDLYTLTNAIVTNESPAQTIARSCPVFVTSQAER